MEGGGAVKAAARAPHHDGHRFESPQLHQIIIIYLCCFKDNSLSVP
jgi:hypothetical protein